jgi:hypothetical protein
MLSDDALRAWEFLSYLVTVLGLPIALFAIWREMRAERRNELKEIEQREDEIYVELSQQYSAFLESALNNPDLDLLGQGPAAATLTPQQMQKRAVYFEMLIALFERAYILLYEPGMSGASARRWRSWDDHIGWWLAKPEFRACVADNLSGEDAEFADYMRSSIAANDPPAPAAATRTT